MVAQIGENAGKVWRSLSDKGPQTVASLSRLTKLDASSVEQAIGWLAKEGKLDFQGNKISLRS